VLNPDAHMFVQDDLYQTEPDFVAAIMTQLSLVAVLNEWGDQAFTAGKSKMKQLHSRNMFKPKHWRELSQVQQQNRAGSVLEYTFILLMEVFNHAIHDLSFEMANLSVIDMEANIHLFTFNFLVGHTRIIWVDHEVNVRQNMYKLPIV
jgi:hypothetical protein